MRDCMRMENEWRLHAKGWRFEPRLAKCTSDVNALSKELYTLWVKASTTRDASHRC
jgi:glutathionyl-hydroquinone reductase